VRVYKYYNAVHVLEGESVTLILTIVCVSGDAGASNAGIDGGIAGGASNSGNAGGGAGCTAP